MTLSCSRTVITDLSFEERNHNLLSMVMNPDQDNITAIELVQR